MLYGNVLLDSGNYLALSIFNCFEKKSPICSLILIEIHDNIYVFCYIFKNDKKYLLVFTNEKFYKISTLEGHYDYWTVEWYLNKK